MPASASSRACTDSLASISLTVTCLPTSRRKSSSDRSARPGGVVDQQRPVGARRRRAAARAGPGCRPGCGPASRRRAGSARRSGRWGRRPSRWPRRPGRWAGGRRPGAGAGRGGRRGARRGGCRRWGRSRSRRSWGRADEALDAARRRSVRVVDQAAGLEVGEHVHGPHGRPASRPTCPMEMGRMARRGDDRWRWWPPSWPGAAALHARGARARRAGAGPSRPRCCAADGSAHHHPRRRREPRGRRAWPTCPGTCVDAVVAIEDARFWAHKGVDVRALAPGRGRTTPRRARWSRAARPSPSST